MHGQPLHLDQLVPMQTENTVDLNKHMFVSGNDGASEAFLRSAGRETSREMLKSRSVT